MMVSGIRADSVTEHRSFTNGIGAITANGTADKRLPGDLLNGDSSGAGRAEYAAISREAGAIIAAVSLKRSRAPAGVQQC